MPHTESDRRSGTVLQEIRSLVNIIAAFGSDANTHARALIVVKMSTSLFPDETPAACVLVQHNGH